MAITPTIGEQGFYWFLAIVEQIDGDPKQLGRVKIRVLNDDDNAETDELDWALVSMPTTSEGVEGVGDTPRLSVGSRVWGFYLDGAEKQQPAVIATFNAIPDNNPKRHSLSWLARGKNILKKTLSRFEPKPAYAAVYPWNRVIQTKSGHVIELDDTPGGERIHIFHKSGSYIEIDKDGRMVIKTETDSYDITNGSKTIYSGEDLNLIAERSIKLAAKGGVSIGAPGGLILTEGSIFTKGSVGSKVGASGVFSTPTGQTVHVQNGMVVSIS